MKRTILIVLGVLLIAGCIWTIRNPYDLPQPEVYNRMQTALASIFCFVAGMCSICMGLCNE